MEPRRRTVAKYRAHSTGAAHARQFPLVALDALLFLALNNISKKWTMPIHNWEPELNRFTRMLPAEYPDFLFIFAWITDFQKADIPSINCISQIY